MMWYSIKLLASCETQTHVLISANTRLSFTKTEALFHTEAILKWH